MEKLVQIEFWQQETMESGGWRRTDFMPIDQANRLIEQRVYESASIADGPPPADTDPGEGESP